MSWVAADLLCYQSERHAPAILACYRQRGVGNGQGLHKPVYRLLGSAARAPSILGASRAE